MTNDAPERIWAFNVPEIEEDNPQCTIIVGEHVMHSAQEYIRKDVSDAAVAAERESCAGIAEIAAERHGACDPECRCGDGWHIAARIRADTDALAAHDARVRAEALREALGRADELAKEAMGADDVRDALLDLIACTPDTDEGEG